MTGLDHKCEVCDVNPMIGVASTAVPYSCAYCKECAQRNAQPEMVFDYWFESGIAPDDHAAPEIETFKDGKYITYREWWSNAIGSGTKFRRQHP